MSRRAVERRNLVFLTKLCVRDLLDNALQCDGREVDSENVHLENFLNLLEICFKHQLKVNPKRNMISGIFSPSESAGRSLWSLLEAIPGASQTRENARQIPDIQTPSGRCRAWIRLALMQKELPEFVARIAEMEDELQQLYDETALFRSDEFALLCGLLVGVNVIDFNFCLKDGDLDNIDTTVNFEPYLRTDVYSLTNGNDVVKSMTSEELKSVLDQKNYTEELNKQLTVVNERLRRENDDMRSRCKSIDTAEDLAQQLQNIKGINLKLFEKLQASKNENENLKQCLTEITKKRDEAVNHSESLESKLLAVQTEYQRSQTAHSELSDSRQQTTILEGELKIEREWRKQLQETNRLQGEHIDRLAKEVAKLKADLKHFETYQQKCNDLDKTLEEMGAKLCDVQIQKEELVEKANSTISSWQDDKEAENCSACQRVFSVSRRRHHCRKCGQIFCGQCSEASMPLIRGGKPVRVCDVCQQELLQQYSVNSVAVQPRKSSVSSISK